MGFAVEILYQRRTACRRDLRPLQRGGREQSTQAAHDCKRLELAWAAWNDGTSWGRNSFPMQVGGGVCDEMNESWGNAGAALSYFPFRRRPRPPPKARQQTSRGRGSIRLIPLGPDNLINSGPPPPCSSSAISFLPQLLCHLDRLSRQLPSRDDRVQHHESSY